MPAPIVPILIGAAVIGGAMLLGKKSHPSATPPAAPKPGTPGTVPFPVPGVPPAGGYTAPPIVPPSGTGTPWWEGGPLPSGTIPGTTPTGPIPGTTTGPATAAPDAGVAGLPEPLKTTTVMAMSSAKGVEGANSLDGLALELDRIGQHKAAYEVRARSNELRKETTNTSGGNLGDPSLQYPGYPPTGVFPGGYGPPHVSGGNLGDPSLQYPGVTMYPDGYPTGPASYPHVAAMAIPFAASSTPMRMSAPAFATAPTTDPTSGHPSTEGPDDMRAQHFGAERGMADRCNGQPFWPGGAVIHSDIYRDGPKLGWSREKLLHTAAIIRYWYQWGYERIKSNADPACNSRRSATVTSGSSAGAVAIPLAAPAAAQRAVLHQAYAYQTPMYQRPWGRG